MPYENNLPALESILPYAVVILFCVVVLIATIFFYTEIQNNHQKRIAASSDDKDCGKQPRSPQKAADPRPPTPDDGDGSPKKEEHSPVAPVHVETDEEEKEDVFFGTSIANNMPIKLIYSIMDDEKRKYRHTVRMVEHGRVEEKQDRVTIHYEDIIVEQIPYSHIMRVTYFEDHVSVVVKLDGMDHIVVKFYGRKDQMDLMYEALKPHITVPPEACPSARARAANRSPSPSSRTLNRVVSRRPGRIDLSQVKAAVAAATRPDRELSSIACAASPERTTRGVITLADYEDAEPYATEPYPVGSKDEGTEDESRQDEGAAGGAAAAAAANPAPGFENVNPALLNDPQWLAALQATGYFDK
eukprot:scpid87469/ scgid35242/ 